MVADDVVQVSMLYVALHVVEMRKAFVALGVFRHFAARQQGSELHGDAACVDHLVLCAARMHASAGNLHIGGGAVEVFIIEAAKLAAVERVGEIAAEALDVELIRACADFLVRGKCDMDFAVGEVVFDDVFRSLHDLGYACLVVCAEQGGTVGNDKRLTLEFFENREIFNIGDDAELFVEDNVFAVVIFNDAGFDVCAGDFFCGIHVCDEADDVLLFTVCGNGAVNITPLVHVCVFNAHGDHFIGKVLCEQLLLHGGRHGGAGRIGLGVVAYVIQKFFFNGHFQSLLKFLCSYAGHRCAKFIFIVHLSKLYCKRGNKKALFSSSVLK